MCRIRLLTARGILSTVSTNLRVDLLKLFRLLHLCRLSLLRPHFPLLCRLSCLRLLLSYQSRAHKAYTQITTRTIVSITSMSPSLSTIAAVYQLLMTHFYSSDFHLETDATRRPSGSSHRNVYEDRRRSSSTGSHAHDGHRHHNHSSHSHDSSSSSHRRNKIYAGVGDDGHHVGDSGSRHRDRGGDGRGQGW